MKRSAIFLDRDGVINKEINYLHKIQDFTFLDGVCDSLKYFQKNQYLIIIITNQSGIGRGIYSLDDFLTLNNWMLNKFEENNILISEVFFCPHSPEDKCDCRKPKPGMINSAIKKFNIDPKSSWMIGDKEDDIQAAIKAGINHHILVRSGHKIDEKGSRAEYISDSIKEAGVIIEKFNSH